MWSHLQVGGRKGHPECSLYPSPCMAAPSSVVGTHWVRDKYLCDGINAETDQPQRWEMTRESQPGQGPVIADCNVSLTSLETQPPAEEGTGGYKMEIEGEWLQSSCRGSTSPTRRLQRQQADLTARLLAHKPGPVLPAWGRPPKTTGTQASGRLPRWETWGVLLAPVPKTPFLERSLRGCCFRGLLP